MKTHRWTIEHALYLLAFLLALGVRLLRLGATPLPDFEAGWALQALAISGQGQMQPALGPNPGYAMITGFLFYLFGSSNGLARLLPAVAGAMLVWLPLFFRREIGQTAALILAFGLALDPGLVAVSRTAGNGMPALSFSLLALAAMYRRRAMLAGLLGGLALLSGTGILVGAVGLALTWGLMRLLEKTGGWNQPTASEILSPEASLPDETSDTSAPSSSTHRYGDSLRMGFYVMAGTVLLIGTLFFRFPQGLGALAGTLTAYLEGWAKPSGVPALRLPIALLIYQPLPVIFGIAGAVRGWMHRYARHGMARRLSLWAIIALLAAMLYPARQVSDLIWVLIPLWALAALEFADGLASLGETQHRLIVVGQAVLLFLLLAFAWNYLLVLSNADLFSGPIAFRNIMILLVSAVVMGALTTGLVSLGWSWSIARRGLSWGISLTLGLYMLANMGGVSQVRPSGEQELWSHIPSYGETELLVKTASELSEWKTGHPHMLDVVLLADSPSLRWAFRSWPAMRYALNLAPNDQPSAIVAYKGQEPSALSANYRGQDFAWEVYPGWQGTIPPDLPRWLAFRQAPRQQTELILWARADLFPGSLLQPLPEIEFAPEEPIEP